MLFEKDSYLMVHVNSLPEFNKDKSYHITIKYNPIPEEIELYNIDKLGELVYFKTSNISIREDNLTRIDIEDMWFESGEKLIKLDKGITHITVKCPKKIKPVESNYFKPKDVLLYDHTLIGIYSLKIPSKPEPIFNLFDLV